MKEKQTHPEVGEDATQYGEFVSTYFAWIPLPDQKEKAEEMAKMTKTEPEPNWHKNTKKRTGTKLSKSQEVRDDI